ncbi:MAG: hypothetical protein K6C07_08370 [Bacteroidales bacterium]|nr:hypothetical protein [Bacteroidales bacterium]
MKIYGYSERGAMNALFYGMALDKEHGEESMRAFIKNLAKIEGNFSEFELFNEFSLSDFGDPDLMIKAKNEKGEHVIFFIEAKASCSKKYNLDKQKKQHDNYMDNGTDHENGHASNLFFQLRLKHYFYNVLPYLFGDNNNTIAKQDSFFKETSCFKNYSAAKTNRLKQSRGRNRKIGENVVVERMVSTIKDCQQAYYIAIIPKQDSKACLNALDTKKEYGFTTHTITWEKIYNSEFKDYIKDTIEFNQNINGTKSQILNNP